MKLILQKTGMHRVKYIFYKNLNILLYKQIVRSSKGFFILIKKNRDPIFRLTYAICNYDICTLIYCVKDNIII